MSINCKELFEIFIKVGGKLTCLKDLNECKFEPQNIICKDLSKNKKELKNMLVLLDKCDNSFIKYINEDIITGIKLRFFQNYQLSSCIGYEINFRINSRGEKIPVDINYWNKFIKIN